VWAWVEKERGRGREREEGEREKGIRRNNMSVCRILRRPRVCGGIERERERERER
jgi:hypothetical protein